MRRLPIYLLIDCSESMVGEPIEAVQSGLEALSDYLRTDVHALETAYLSMITFAYTARQESPLVEAGLFQPAHIQLGSGTALGQALEILEKCLSSEIKKPTNDSHGDFKPLVFILTDGEPTDFWELVADRFKSTITGRKAFIFAVACGPEGNVQKLKRITDETFLARNMDRETIKNLFRWVSTSVVSVSRSLMMNDPEGAKLIDSIPSKYLEKVDKDISVHLPIPDRFIYLHSRCTKSKEFYIMKYEKYNSGPEQGRKFLLTHYRGISAHKVQEFDFSSLSRSGITKISSNQFENNPLCPYCGDRVWAKCTCGKIHCCPDDNEESTTLTCPWCGETGNYQFSTFKIDHGLG